jgi:hypothetical protein
LCVRGGSRFPPGDSGMERAGGERERGRFSIPVFPEGRGFFFLDRSIAMGVKFPLFFPFHPWLWRFEIASREREKRMTREEEGRFKDGTGFGSTTIPSLGSRSSHLMKWVNSNRETFGVGSFARFGLYMVSAGGKIGAFRPRRRRRGRGGILWMHRQVVAWKFVFHIIKKSKSIRLTLGRAAHTEEIPHNPSKHRFPFQLFMPTRTWLFRLECGSRGSGSAPFRFGDSISVGERGRSRACWARFGAEATGSRPRPRICIRTMR